MKPLLIVLAVLVAIGSVVWLGIRGQRRALQTVETLERQVVAPYLDRVARGELEAAYAQHLSTGYRAALTLEDYTRAQQRRRAELGGLTGRERRRSTSSGNLFSSERTHQILYELSFAQGKRMALFEVSERGADSRIEGTFDGQGRREIW
jgi:hypothetical protein